MEEKSKVDDPHNKINQLNLFFDLLSKPKNGKSIMENLSQNILCKIKRSTNILSIKGNWLKSIEEYFWQLRSW